MIGDFAKTPRYQGAGSSLVNASRVSTALDAWGDAGFDSAEYAQGFRRDGRVDEALAHAAVGAAAKADVAVVYLGLDEISESEGADREHLRLADNQVDLLARVRAANDRVVVVLSAGAVVEMPWTEHASAVVHGYLGGQAGAEAMVDILTGVECPSGRLAETYPMALEDTPTYGCFPSRGAEARVSRGTLRRLPLLRDRRRAGALSVWLWAELHVVCYDDLRVTDAGATFSVTNTGDARGPRSPRCTSPARAADRAPRLGAQGLREGVSGAR